MPIFTPPSRLQVPTHTSHTTPRPKTTRSCHTCSWLQKVRRGLLLLLKARCLHRACRKNQTVIFVLPRFVLSPTRGSVRERSLAIARIFPAETVERPISGRLRIYAAMPGLSTHPVPKAQPRTATALMMLLSIPNVPVPLIITKPVTPLPGRKGSAHLAAENTKNAATSVTGILIPPFRRGMSARENVRPATARNTR